MIADCGHMSEPRALTQPPSLVISVSHLPASRSASYVAQKWEQAEAELMTASRPQQYTKITPASGGSLSGVWS